VPPFTIHGAANYTLLPSPLTTTQCQAAYDINCYTATQLRTAYDVAPLSRRGIDGRGVTVVIPIPYGSPTLRHDLHVFDQKFGLPDPDLRIVPFGDIPAYDPTSAFMVDLAAGTTEEVDSVHAMAPAAKIVVAETTITGSGPVAGLPELMRAEKSLVDQGVGDIFDQILATAEGTFPGVEQGDDSSLLDLRFGFQDAQAHHVTTVAAAGDFGVTEFDADGNLSTTPSLNWPASDPLVTSVGGARLSLDDAGRTLRRPTGWSDFGEAGAGGLSEVFPAPSYQSGVAGVVGAHRGIPDVTMSAAVDGGTWIYTSFGGTGGAGWDIFDGSGIAAALFTGVVALADQSAGHRLGSVNPALYRLGALRGHGEQRTGLVDITQGDNSLAGVTGYVARPGYDLDTGWGTVDAGTLVPALVRASSSH
jgi:subtilase family serine protease